MHGNTNYLTLTAPVQNKHDVFSSDIIVADIKDLERHDFSEPIGLTRVSKKLFLKDAKTVNRKLKG